MSDAFPRCVVEEYWCVGFMQKETLYSETSRVYSEKEARRKMNAILNTKENITNIEILHGWQLK